MNSEKGGFPMVEIAQLEQLVTFADCGTLSKAAEELHISQPTLTRSMQKLENEFRVPLFTHSKNKLALNENGVLAVEYAKKTLNQASDMLEKVRSFDRSRNTLSVGFCAPAPQWEILPQLTQLYSNMTISSELKGNETLLSGLFDGTYQMVVYPEMMDEPTVECKKWGEENLMLFLPDTHPLAASSGVYLKELDGENMLLFSEIGFWHDMPVKKMPHSRFLLQNERFAFNELVSSSILPSFTSDLVERHPEQHAGVTHRVRVPILDAEAHVSYYCCYLKKNKGTLTGIFERTAGRLIVSFCLYSQTHNACKNAQSYIYHPDSCITAQCLSQHTSEPCTEKCSYLMRKEQDSNQCGDLADAEIFTHKPGSRRYGCISRHSKTDGEQHRSNHIFRHKPYICQNPYRTKSVIEAK
jgi:DNA-binding transcriptional LysR family regulator